MSLHICQVSTAEEVSDRDPGQCPCSGEMHELDQGHKWCQTVQKLCHLHQNPSESAMIMPYWVEHTFSCFKRLLARTAWLFVRSPFEILLVTSASYIALLALLASGFGLVAFETFCFARDTACSCLSVLLSRKHGDRVSLGFSMCQCFETYHCDSWTASS